MAAETVGEKIRKALGEYLRRDAASIAEDDHLRDDLGLDSMAVIELLYKIEETFDFQIPDQDLQGLSTVGDVVRYVNRRLGASQAAAKPRKPKPAGRKKA